MQIQFPLSLALGSCAFTIALSGKGALPSRGDLGGSFTHSIYPSNPLANSIFVDVDGKAGVEGNSLKRTRIEWARGDSMTAHVYDCFSAEVTDVAILPYPQNYTQAMKQPDASKWTEAIGLELQQLVRLKIFSEPVLLPEGAQLIGTRLIFKKKRTADG